MLPAAAWQLLPIGSEEGTLRVHTKLPLKHGCEIAMIEKISILSGHGRNDRAESFGRIDMAMGQVVSIVRADRLRQDNTH